MKKRPMFFASLVMAISLSGIASAEEQSPIYFNETLIEFSNPVIREHSSTVVPVREFCEQAGYTVVWNETMREVIVLNDDVKVIMTIGNKNIQVQSEALGDYDVLALLPPQINNSVTYIPLRAVAESLGAEVIWCEQDDSTHITTKNWEALEDDEDIAENPDNEEENAKDEEPINEDIEEEEGKEEQENTDFTNTFYSQYDPEYIRLYNDEIYKWTEGRNGYCYVTSYAMLISDILGEEVTPKDIADINLEKGGDPSYCYHWDILEKYDVTFKKAIDEDSLYFKEYDAGRGLTYIDNSDEEMVVEAIKESLLKNPKGVMVRDLSMPHTLVAVGFDDDGIYFNDPALSEGGVLWEETCLGNKEITTISAIIALK